MPNTYMPIHNNDYNHRCNLFNNYPNSLIPFKKYNPDTSISKIKDIESFYSQSTKRTKKYSSDKTLKTIVVVSAMITTGGGGVVD